MKLSQFKIVKNKQRPDFCYAYEKYNSSKTQKYSLFTMDGGNNFLASVTSSNSKGKIVDTDFSETFSTKEEGLIAIEKFVKENE